MVYWWVVSDRLWWADLSKNAWAIFLSQASPGTDPWPLTMSLKFFIIYIKPICFKVKVDLSLSSMELKMHISSHMRALNMTAFKFRVQLKFIFWQVLKRCHVLYNLYHLSIRVWNHTLEMFYSNLSLHCAAQQPDSCWWPITSQMRLRQNTWIVTIESMLELQSWELYQEWIVFVI